MKPSSCSQRRTGWVDGGGKGGRKKGSMDGSMKGMSGTNRLFSSLLQVFVLPLHFLARLCGSRNAQPWFIRESSVFEDFIQIVRYGFMYFPTDTLRVFLSKQFAYPLLKWRMFRSGFFSLPAHLQEKALQEVRLLPVSLFFSFP